LKGVIKVVTFLLSALLLIACSPVVSTTTLAHSIVKGDTIGTVSGIFSKLVSAVTPEEDKPKKKSRAEIMEDLRKALER